jgi:hypothetical protein
MKSLMLIVYMKVIYSLLIGLFIFKFSFMGLDTCPHPSPERMYIYTYMSSVYQHIYFEFVFYD